MWAAVVVSIGVAWFAAGVLALILVAVVDLLIVSYFKTPQLVGWRTGRPSRVRKAGVPTPGGEDLPADPDVIEGWLRERLLDGLPDDRD